MNAALLAQDSGGFAMTFAGANPVYGVLIRR
jgi:hypothetical protein